MTNNRLDVDKDCYDPIYGYGVVVSKAFWGLGGDAGYQTGWLCKFPTEDDKFIIAYVPIKECYLVEDGKIQGDIE